MLPYMESWSFLRDGQSLLLRDDREFGARDRMAAKRTELWIGESET